MSETTPQLIQLGSAAKGSIEPRGRDLPWLNELYDDLSAGKFFVPVSQSVASGCIDGRLGGQIRTSSAGGTISLLVARDLTTDSAAESTEQLLSEVIETLKASNLPVGGHDDDFSPEDKTGCGANDKLATIYEMLVKKSDAVRAFAEQLGVTVDDTTHHELIAAAEARVEFSDPHQLTEQLRQADKHAVDTLRNTHNEVVVTINTRPNTTLNHAALADEYGDSYEAFNVDAWAFLATAKAIARDADNDAEVAKKVAALTYYNLATALTLCGSSMNLLVVSS